MAEREKNLVVKILLHLKITKVLLYNILIKNHFTINLVIYVAARYIMR